MTLKQGLNNSTGKYGLRSSLCNQKCKIYLFEITEMNFATVGMQLNHSRSQPRKTLWSLCDFRLLRVYFLCVFWCCQNLPLKTSIKAS